VYHAFDVVFFTHIIIIIIRYVKSSSYRNRIVLLCRLHHPSLSIHKRVLLSTTTSPPTAVTSSLSTFCWGSLRTHRWTQMTLFSRPFRSICIVSLPLEYRSLPHWGFDLTRASFTLHCVSISINQSLIHLFRSGNSP